MNQFIWKYIIVFPLLLILTLWGCQKKPAIESPVETRSLIQEFSKDWLQVGHDKFTFQDAVIKKKLLRTGWLLDDNPTQTRFPWPRFTETGGSIALQWAQRMERRIKIKVVNFSLSYPSDFLAVTLNGHFLTKMNNAGRPGEYEFYLPSSFQVPGENLIHISVKPGIFSKSDEFNSIGLHSLGITLGAVVKNTICIGDQARNSLLFAPPIALEIPYQASSQQFLQFSYGLYSIRSEKYSADYMLTVTLLESNKSTVVFQKDIPLHHSSAQKSTWKFIKLKLPNIDKNGILKISFQAKSDLSFATDYLALSEVLVKPRHKNWSMKIENKEPDVMFVSLSSVSAGQIGAYGNPAARTPFLDKLSKTGFLQMDMSASTNAENGSLVSIATGKYPRDHGFYRSNTTILDSVMTLPDAISNTHYQSNGFVHTKSSSHTPFLQMPAFKRIYLSDPQDSQLSIVQKQFENAVFSPCLQTNPGFYWMHLSPELCQVPIPRSVFPPETYSTEKIPITSMNLPVSEQERLLDCLGKDSEEADLRLLLSNNDERLRKLDKFLENLLSNFIEKRKKRSIILVISADHGLIRSVDSNVLSADSLAQEVIHVPFIMTMIGKNINSSKCTTNRLFSDPISNIKIFDILTGLIRHPDIATAFSVIDQSINRNIISPIFSEHSQRPIVAFRKNNYKFIHCLSDPYFQIATTNLFDLEENPSETINLASRDAAYTRQLLEPVLAFCRGSTFYPEPRPGFDNEALEILKSLNYTAR